MVLLFASRLEVVFPETGLPMKVILGNSAAGRAEKHQDDMMTTSIKTIAEEDRWSSRCW
jgi:hypothetical protein